MERGGTITWYLTANDADFAATNRKVREDAKKTGNDVDRDFKRGFGNAKLTLDDFHRSLGRSASAFRNFQIALRGFELNALIIGATIAGGAIIELAGAVASLVGILYTAPAAIAAFGGAFATLKIATSGVADSFKALTKQQAGVSAGQSLAKKQADIMKTSMKQDAALTRRLTSLKEDYADVVKELAEERLRILNEQIQKGVDAWGNITDAAQSYLNVSKALKDLTQDVTDAQAAYNTALITYGPASQQALEAQRDLLAAQAKVADSNAELDSQYTSIADNVKDLATNLTSLQKANRNELSASSLSLKALRLDKQARGEDITEISKMIDVLDQLIDVKDAKLTLNPDLAGAQAALDGIKSQFPDIAVAAAVSASNTENSLNKSLQNITDQMADIGRQRVELQQELSDSLKEAMESAAGSAVDPFEGLSKNAKAFVIALDEVRDQYQSLRNVVQDNFFAGLDTALRQVATTSLPMLTKGLGLVATAMNGVLLEAARVVQQPFFQNAIADSLKNTAAATDILKGAVEPLAVAFTNLMNIGNPYLLMLSQWIVKQTELFAAFTSSKEGQDSITNSINLGIVALQQLMGLLGAVVGFFKDLFEISNNSGVSILSTLTEMVNKMREYIGTEEGQARMVALFQATDTILRALGNVIGFVLNGILGIVQAYNDLDGPAKSFVTNLLVFSAVATPVLSYISAQFASLKLIVLGGAEALQLFGVDTELLGKKLGGLDKVFGLIARNPIIAIIAALVAVFVYLGTQTDVFKNAFEQLKPVFDEFMKALEPVFALFGELAKVLGGALATIIPVIAEVFGQILAALLPLIPPLLQLVMTLLPVLVTVLQAVIGIIQFLMPVITVLVQILGVILVAAINIVVAVLKFLIEVIINVVKWFVDGWNGIVAIWNGAGQFFTDLWNGIVAVFSVVIDFFKGLFQGAWDAIVFIWNFAIAYYTGIWNGIVKVFSVVATFFKDMFQKAWDGIKGIWNSVGSFFSGIWDNIVNAFSGAFNLGKDIVTGLWNGISNMAQWVVNKVKGFAGDVLGGIKNFFGIKSPSRVMRDEVGKMLGLGIAGGIVDSTGEAVKAAKSAAEQITEGFAMGALNSDLGINASGTLTSQFAPAMLDGNTNSNSGLSAGGIVINQTNEVYSELDMDQVNRNLTWELNKV